MIQTPWWTSSNVLWKREQGECWGKNERGEGWGDSSFSRNECVKTGDDLSVDVPSPSWQTDYIPMKRWSITRKSNRVVTSSKILGDIRSIQHHSSCSLKLEISEEKLRLLLLLALNIASPWLYPMNGGSITWKCKCLFHHQVHHQYSDSMKR